MGDGFGKGVRTLTGHTLGVTSIAFSADGSMLASGSEDKSIKIGNAFNGKSLMTLNAHSDSVTALAFSPNGKILVSGGGSGDPAIKFWNVSTGMAAVTANERSVLVDGKPATAERGAKIVGAQPAGTALNIQQPSLFDFRRQQSEGSLFLLP